MRTWIEQQKYLIDFTLSSLARRKSKCLSLLLIYTLIVFLLASVMLFTHALRRHAALALAHAPDVVVQRMVAGRHDLIASSYLDRIGDLRGVRKKEARLWGYYFDPVSRANSTVMVPSAGTVPEVAHGRVVLGASMARSFGTGLRDTLVLQSYAGDVFTFAVAGILPVESDLVTADLILVSEDDFRSFFNYPPNHYTDIALTVANPQELRNVAAKLARRLPDTRAILRDEILRTYESIFSWREGIVLVLLSGAVLAFAIFAMEKATGLSAEEKREIGILKAIGWETGDVIRMKFWEGALVSFTAFLLGYTAAYLHVFRFSSGLFAPVLKGWSTLYPRMALSPALDAFQVATLFYFTVFPYALATIVPIWRAAVTDPDSVMRG
ncbi:ABC transporter permease [Paludibaculum fermentans]|uniref:ABC transporter permease n=1 Tax=Paludibaculum fermentans TaxID=1473598 RepID=UPI003EBB8696